MLQKQNFKQIGSDSAVPGLNRNQAYDTVTVIPEIDKVQRFNTLVQVVFDGIFSTAQQADTLVEIRDTLLPKLMSGEIEI